MSFGQVLATARKQANMTQKELAAHIRKEDGRSITPQYLNDLERDRRNPPPEALLVQLAAVLKIPRELLYYQAGRLLPEMTGIQADDDRVVRAYTEFLTIMRDGTGGTS